jgi:hypothetical protein
LKSFEALGIIKREARKRINGSNTLKCHYLSRQLFESLSSNL